MPYILYGGVKYYKTRNAVYCKACKETVESNDLRDFKMCSCGLVGVDGGPQGRILGDPCDIDSRAVHSAMIGGKLVILPGINVSRV
jgi:hypothetical protein